MRVAKDHRPVIRKAAARLFGHRRFDEVLIDDVASAAGVAKGTIYRFYRNKEELYADICLSSLEDLNSRLSDLARGTESAQVRLRQMIECVAEHFGHNRDFFHVMLQEWGGAWSKKRAAFLASRQDAVKIFARVIRDGQKDGAFTGTDAYTSADMLLGMIRSMVRFGDPKLSPQNVAETILSIFLFGILTRKKETADERR
ncbi:MAG TPA: TetR/AcrR family transcriptional regulator [Planctomycetota bacterium]